MILIDGRPLQLGSSVRGIGRYVRELLCAFGEMGVIDGMELLLSRGSPAPADISRLGVRTAAVAVPRLKPRVQPIIDPFLLSAVLGRLRPALYHATEYAQPLSSTVPVVITVHDLVPFLMPDLYPWMRRERLLALRLLRRADAVIADSAATAHDACELARVEPDRVTVVPLGVAPPPPRRRAELDEVRQRLRLPEQFMLAVATFDPRKRIGLLADVTARVRREHDVSLVIAGDQGNYAAAVRAALERAGITAAASVLGYVSDADLDALYRLCAVLVHTSSYEGFGLTPLEAMARGAPVALFDNSALTEVAGDVAIMVADGDAAAMAACIVELLGDPEQRRRLRAGGLDRAARFTWRRTAEQTVAVYERLLSGHG